MDVQQQLAAPGSLLPGLGGIMTEGRGAGEQRHGMIEHGRRRNDVQTPSGSPAAPPTPKAVGGHPSVSPPVTPQHTTPTLLSVSGSSPRRRGG